MKRAIAYIRVSGLGQVDKDGEARQSESIRTFCTTHGLEYWEQKFEKGVSGTVEGLDRPVFRYILDTIAAIDAQWGKSFGGAISLANEFPNAPSLEQNRPCIVVERMDRLARDLMVQELLLRECRDRGIQVYAADQPFIDVASDSGDPTRKLFRQIMGALAEWEKSALVLKLRKARERKRAATGRCEGFAPFVESKAGKNMLERVLLLRKEGVSLQGVADRLNEGRFRTRWGKRWTKRAVIHLLKTQNKNKGTKCEEVTSVISPEPGAQPTP